MSTQNPHIYLDHSATTPVRPEVMAAMQPYFADFYGNPSSIHSVGRKAHAGLQQARRTVAQVLGVRESEILFTSCGSESDNAAVRGIAMARRRQSGVNRIVTSAVEHKAVLATAQDLAENYGFALTVLPVDGEGRVRVADVAAALGPDVALVSIMYANNEIGAVQPLAEIGELCRAAGIPLHTDAVQAVGRLPIQMIELGVDALSVSAHKFYGPKGVGFLYLRNGVPFLPIQTGGGHEGNRRAGTENVPYIVGMARALELADGERVAENNRLRVLRDQLVGGILEEVAGARLTGSATHRLANHASFVIAGVEAEGILIGLDMAGIAASSGSACTSAAQKPSHVLEAIGVPATEAAGGLRLSLGRSNTPEQVTVVLAHLSRIVAQIRGALPVTL